MSLYRNVATAAAVTALGSLFAIPANALTLFGNSGIRFDTDTTINFDFLSSHGIYKSDFGVQEVGGSFVSLLKEVQNADTQSQNVEDWKGSCGISVLTCSTSYTFKAGVDYSFVLQSYEKVRINNDWGYYNTPTTVVYSSLPQSAVFSQESNTSYKLDWDDGYGGDRDTNDFTIRAAWTSQRSVSVPEPTALAGLGIVGGSFLITRRRRVKWRSLD